ncbi:MAG TPA: hypothetical protein VFZ23_09450 [Pyrinomonadaceae bacterium]
MRFFRTPGLLQQILFSLVGLLIAIPLGLSIGMMDTSGGGNPEAVAKLVGLLFLILGILPTAIYILWYRKNTNIANVGLVLIATVGVFLSAVYIFQASYYMMFPADVFIWSESDFVNDIIKFRQGYPIFTDHANNESLVYLPGAQLLTYSLAKIAGAATSLPLYRAIQLLFVAGAAVFAFLCCRRLVQLAAPENAQLPDSRIWGLVWLPILFLAATNSLTNPFVHLLHNDALALLLSIFGYWLLVEYEATGNRRLLWFMLIVPGVGFWVKQNLILWGFIYFVYLWFRGQGLSRARTVLIGLGGALGVVSSVLISYLLWGDHFVYWTYTVLSERKISVVRSFHHLIEVWPYLAAGLVGGVVLLERGFGRLVGLWAVWLFLILTQVYTTGVAWTLSHIGPGSLMAASWFMAALPFLWDRIAPAVSLKQARAAEFVKLGASVAIVCLSFGGLGMIRPPVKPFGDDALRYIHEIENEFDGLRPEEVLLDLGSWVYLPRGVVMKDRAATIGDRGYANIGDFSGILDRLNNRRYKKILVRGLHSPDFWYDHVDWPASSGIRSALLANYEEVKRIGSVEGRGSEEVPYGFREVSVLVPRSDSELRSARH